MKKLIITTLIIILHIDIFSQGVLPYSESFESGWGIWTQSTDDQFDWTRHSGPTPTPNTGPNSAQDGDYYIYIEATGHSNPPETAIIEADFDFSGTTMPVLSFYYHMYGDSIGNLHLYAYDGSQWTEIWNAFNNHGDQWNNVKICLGDYANNPNVKLRFKAETQYSDLSDIAIDNISIVDFKIDNISHTDVSCGGYADGTITIDVNGGFSPYYYSIDDGVNYTQDENTSHQFTGLSGGDYLIRVKDDAGCVISGGVETINEPPTPDISVSKTDVQPCEYSNNGTIDINVSNGNPPYEYSIHGASGPFQSSNHFAHLGPGTYQIAVRESTGCIADGGTITINAPYAIHIYDIQVNNVETCYGDSTGSLKIIAGGGHTPLSYSIDEGNTFQNDNYFPNLPADTYRFIIQDSQGCLDTSEYVTITQPTQVVINSISHTDVSGCYGDHTGTISIEASGGTGNLQYSIDNGYYFQDTGYFNNLAAGTYNILVRDQNNCQASGGSITISQPSKVVLDSVKKQDVSDCYGNANGSITIYAHGGTPPMHYSIDSGNTFQNSNVFSPLDVGTYYPYVKDDHGCSDTAQPITITQPSELQITNINKYDINTCYGDSTGKIQIFAQNGTPPYRYSIDGGVHFQENYTFDSLKAGTYYTVVKDYNNCEAYGDTITLNQPPQIIIDSIASSDASCHGQNDGTIYVHAYGGTGEIKYSIDGGNSFPFNNGQITSQGAGIYPIAVIDQNHCKAIGDTVIINEPDSLKIDSIVKIDVQGCYGDSTGEIFIYAEGGTPPYQYSIDNGLHFQDSSHFVNLPAKTGYIPFVKDAHGCITYSSPVTIGQPPQLVVNSQTHTDIDTCHGVPAGTITIIASGGTPPLYYSIDNGLSFENNNGHFDSLYAGTYQIKVKDSHGCIANGWQETIHQPDTLLIDSVRTWDVLCHSQGNGKIYIYASGGQPQLYYSIDGGTTFSPSYQFLNLAGGTYHIVVKDNFNCRVDTSVQIHEPPALYLDSVIHTDVSTCWGDSTGTITIFAHGGVAPITYSYAKIGNPFNDFSLDNVFNNVPAGSYYAAIKDNNGCMLTSEAFTITEPDPVRITNYNKTDITCYGLHDGTITLQAAGGNGIYQYTIDGGNSWVQNDGYFDNLGPGDYHVNVRDTNMCEGNTFYTITIYEPEQIQITNIFPYDITCYGYQDGRIVVYASGGTMPYSYSLNDGEFQASNTFDSLSQGTYWATVRDINGCTAYSDTVQINMPENEAYFSIDTNEACAPLLVNFYPSHPNTSDYLWIFGDGDSSWVKQPSHIYRNNSSEITTFTATAIAYHQNCSDTARANITVYPQPTIFFNVSPDTLYYPSATINITTYSTDLENYFWNFGDGQTYQGTFPMQHTYDTCGVFNISATAMNDFQCYDTAMHTVIVNAINPSASFSPNITKGCQPLTVHFTNTSANALKYNWLIDNNPYTDSTNFSYTFDDEGTYKITLNAYGYCNTTDQTTQFIYVYPSPKIDFYAEPDTVAVNQEIMFYNNTTNAAHYIWDFGDGTFSGETDPIHKYNAPGTYSVKLTAYSSNGCTDSLRKDNLIFVSNKFFIKFPTAFTPGSGDQNAIFKPTANMVDYCYITIFDRYGQIVYQTDDYKTMAWDGTNMNGKPLPSDIYVWQAIGKYINGEPIKETGTVLLLR